MLEAVRKAESGREGKKIPERDEGFVAARSLAGQTVVVDPGHGGTDHGVVGARGLTEKDYTLALGSRLAQLLRAEGCRVRLTRDRDERVGTYARAEIADAARADFFLSLHLAAHPSRRRTARPATTSSAITTSPSTASASPAASAPGSPRSARAPCRRWAATTPCCASRAPSPSSSSRSSSPIRPMRSSP